MSSRPNVALVGLGAWGRNHFRVLRELGVLRRVFDVDPSVLATLPADMRAPSWAALLDDPEVDAVVVATPAPTHFELARDALLRGKDVFVEKPMTLRSTDADTLVEIADRGGRVLMVGHVTLFHPALTALRAWIRRGDLGVVRYLQAQRLNLGTVRPSEDILWSFAPHDFAAMIHVLDANPVRVRAIGAAWLLEDRSDVTVTHLEFPEGVKAHVHVSWLHPHREHRLTVVGDRKMATFDDDGRGGTLRLWDTGVDLRDGTLVHRREGHTEVDLPTVEPLRAQMEHFVDACRTRREPLTGGRHGAAVVRVLDAASRSLRADGEPVGVGRPIEVRA
jgi:predicted dehydrogenase